MRHYQKVMLYLLLLLVPSIWLVCLSRYPTYWTDFQPLYFAAQRIVQGQSPYGPQATYELTQFWYSEWANAGVAYPLPFILLILPLTLFSLPLAAFLWTAFGFLTSYSCVLLARAQSMARQQPAWYKTASLLIPFTFWPFYEGVRLSQATLIWFGITMLMLFSIQRKNGWATAVCVVLLTLKPQTSIIFALYGLYWLWRNHRGGLIGTVALGAALFGTSLLIQPDWITAWLGQMEIYKAYVKITWLLPLGGIMLYIAWRFPLHLWAKLAIFQTFLFPMTGIYSLLPLLLAWVTLSPLLALLGTSLTLIWSLLPQVPTLGTAWVFLICPLILALLWEAHQRRNAQTATHTPDHQPVSTLTLEGSR